MYASESSLNLNLNKFLLNIFSVFFKLGQPRPLFVYFLSFQQQFYRKIIDFSGIRLLEKKASTPTTWPLPRPNLFGVFCCCYDCQSVEWQELSAVPNDLAMTWFKYSFIGKLAIHGFLFFSNNLGTIQNRRFPHNSNSDL